MSRKAEAIRYAEASRGLNDNPIAIARACEEILLSSGFAVETGLAALRWIAAGYGYEITGTSPCLPPGCVASCAQRVQAPGTGAGNAEIQEDETEQHR